MRGGGGKSVVEGGCIIKDEVVKEEKQVWRERRDEGDVREV
jgi:hypothetical protein